MESIPTRGVTSTVDMQGQYDVHSARPTFSEADFRFVAPRGARPDRPASRLGRRKLMLSSHVFGGQAAKQ